VTNKKRVSDEMMKIVRPLFSVQTLFRHLLLHGTTHSLCVCGSNLIFCNPAEEKTRLLLYFLREQKFLWCREIISKNNKLLLGRSLKKEPHETHSVQQMLKYSCNSKNLKRCFTKSPIRTHLISISPVEMLCFQPLVFSW
jgi:hypothetical protein